MAVWPPVISQIGYPGAGDIDDCWCVATIWAALASDPNARKPTVPQFRKAAGDPDDGIRDGGSNDECMKGAQGIWHDEPDATRWEGTWAGFAALVKAGRPASLAIRSSALPAQYRFGFMGAHRVGAAYDKARGTFLLMNPLARSGAALQPIMESDLKRAAQALLPSRQTIGLLFPSPNDLRLRYGARKTSPYPDRTRTDEPDVRIHRSPTTSDATVVGIIKAKSTLWIAYQVTTTGEDYKGSRHWYGNRAGDKWVHAARLVHEGGAT